ncbi:hypothetical protein CXB51_007051 [Gossypium anomalum]|uniref:Uncharacterized protein n=1 Tax=Gossypium anomalum TaxID=47600 RepID=A0A8J5ZEI1_9ROSI|nr:hypothetical protein CXB51_007051 [Gossypium anomalum]
METDGCRFDEPSFVQKLTNASFTNLSNAAKGSSSEVHSATSLCPRFISLVECLDKTYIRDTPSKVWNCAVIVFKKAKFDSFSRSSYSLVPGSGMNRWLTVGLFGRYPTYGYCPKLTAASKAEAIHMMMVHAWVRSINVFISSHHVSFLKSSWPSFLTSDHHDWISLLFLTVSSDG